MTVVPRMWKKLLVAHDFSRSSELALDAAVALARETRAAITLLHVCQVQPEQAVSTTVTPAGGEVRVDAHVVAAAERALEELAAPLRAAAVDVAVRAVLGRPGETGDSILAAAAAADADAIVMGTHGRKGLGHLLLGSVAEHVLRRAAVPVVTVRAADG